MQSMPLSDKQRKFLRAHAHALNPVVRVASQGLKPTVLEEIEIALNHHELIKVKVSAGEREARDALIAEICAHSGAELVQRIGHVAVLYRKNPEKTVIELPRG